MESNLFEARKLLRRAKSNLNRGKESNDLELREICIEDLCFDLQQCVEKALKAILIYENVEYPRTHNIAILISLISNSNINMPESITKAARLTPFAVEIRYNDDFMTITPEIYNETVSIAETVYNWVNKQIPLDE